MYRYFFDDDITVENVNNLVEKLQAVKSKITLYFSTDGGSPSAMNFLMDFLNSRKEDIKIVMTGRCYSAGCDIFVFFDGEIAIEELDCVLFHVLDRERYAHRVDSYVADSKTLAKQDMQYNIIFAEKIKNKGLLTGKQIKDFLKGKNVIVYQEQIKTWKL